MSQTATKKSFVTDFSTAWSNYKETKTYTDTVIILEKKGMKQPYIDNIIFLSFTAGYNSKQLQ